MKVQKKVKRKLNVVFDENKRRDFLTGFHKRKLQRKKLAKEKLEEDLKKERKRIKLETKESYKKLIKSFAPLPEVEELLENEYEDEDVNVKIVELSRNEIAEENNWIGANQPTYQSSDDEDQELDDETQAPSEIPGMELKPTSSKATRGNSDTKPGVKTKAEIKKLIKKQATKTVQKSKAFQRKNKIETQKQRKKSAMKQKFEDRRQNKSKKKKVDDKQQNKSKKKRKK